VVDPVWLERDEESGGLVRILSYRIQTMTMRIIKLLVAFGIGCGLTVSCSRSETVARAEDEETLRKIEDKILRAKSFRLNYTLAIHSPRASLPGETRESGLLIVKEGGKIHIKGRTELVGEKAGFVVVSDGQTWTMQGGPTIDASSKIPGGEDLAVARRSGTLRDFLLKSFIHIRLPDSVELKLLFTRGALAIVVPPVRLERITAGSDPEGDFLLCDYRPEPFDGAVEDPDHALAPYRVKLWYDSRTFALRKRVVTLRTGDPAIDHPRSTERFESLEVNIDVPEEQFRLPRDN
jgi:hypothetical protein